MVCLCRRARWIQFALFFFFFPRKEGMFSEGRIIMNEKRSALWEFFYPMLLVRGCLIPIFFFVYWGGGRCCFL